MFLSFLILKRARLAQSVEHQTFNLRVMGSSPISGAVTFYSIAYTSLLQISFRHARSTLHSTNIFQNIFAVIGPLHDPVTWYKITYTGEQIAQWEFQNKGRCIGHPPMM